MIKVILVVDICKSDVVTTTKRIYYYNRCKRIYNLNKLYKKKNYILRIALLLMFFPNNLNLIRYRHNHAYYKGLEIKTKLPKMFPKQRLNLWQLKQAKK
jgi:hypothetical protein